MSAEVENGKEEEEVKVPKTRKPLKKRLQDHWPIGIKVLELVICSICMGCIYDPISIGDYKKSIGHHIGIMYTAFTGYILINCVLLLGRALGDRIPYKTVSIFALMGAALFLITGILLAVDINIIIFNAESNRFRFVSSKTPLRAALQASIAFAFINALVFAADAVLSFVSRNDF